MEAIRRTPAFMHERSSLETRDDDVDFDPPRYCRPPDSAINRESEGGQIETQVLPPLPGPMLFMRRQRSDHKDRSASLSYIRECKAAADQQQIAVQSHETEALVRKNEIQIGTDSLSQPSDTACDASSFGLPRCTPLSAKDYASDLKHAWPAPQPFVRSKKSSQHDPKSRIRFIQACRAAMGKEIAASESGKWNEETDAREKSAASVALYILQSRGQVECGACSNAL